MEKANVYFIKDITSDNVVKIFNELGIKLKGKVGVKVHSGEKGNQNYLKPDFFKPMVDKVNGTIVECNTAYPGARNNTKKHIKLMAEHGWSEMYDVDIMDSERPDDILSIPNGQVIKKDYVGSHLKNYDSMLVLSHFKGHPMGGFGGAIKQLSIGCASSYGKAYIHGAGNARLKFRGDHDKFLESMADSASSVYELFKGNIAFISIMKNMSVDCDCCAVAEDPCMKDIGILASLDPVALDQACVDLVYNSKDPGRDHLVERIESRNGIHTLDACEKIGFGNRHYNLIEIK